MNAALNSVSAQEDVMYRRICYDPGLATRNVLVDTCHLTGFLIASGTTEKKAVSDHKLR